MSEAKEDAAYQLWRLWQEGGRPDLAEFLPTVGPLAPLDLAAVLRVDRHQRWLAGMRLPAEYYLGAYPAVAANEEAALDLVYSEYLLREEQGEKVAPDEYLLRFPQFADQLREQIEIHEEFDKPEEQPSPATIPPRAPGPAPPAAGPEGSTNPAATKAGFPARPVKGEAGSPPSPPDAVLKTVPRGAGGEAIPANVQKRVDDLCDRFESAWMKGRRPQIEDFLTGTAGAERAAVLRELLPLDVGYRKAHGDSPTAGEYLERFPGLDPAWLAAAVAVLAAGEQAGAPGPFRRPRALRIRCPHCHSPIQLIDERPQEVLCPGCGSSFRMREAQGTVSASSLSLGKFDLLERVGCGSFGAVWRARDRALDRIVALKIPHAGLTISSAELQSFLDEARKIAKLRHPGIVTVHEVTTLQGLPVIVSDFISGVTLKDFLEVRRPSFEETARLIAEVAEALHHAHGNGLVHRDVKPANIMVERGRVAAEGRAVADLGRPLMLDFGLALREEAEITMTVDGLVIGTPAYINPEQAARRGHQADRRSDVFSLGVVLYEMLTGELPFRGSTEMMLSQVMHDDPRPPRRINERIPRDLETICLKAMAKLPAHRYQTAADLAADLGRFLKGETIHARPAGRTEKLWRWCLRHPRDAALAGAVLGLLVLLAVGSTTAALWINHERQRAEAGEKDANDQKANAVQQEILARTQEGLARTREAEAKTQRARAEKHLAQTLEAVNQLGRVAREVVDDAPGMEQDQEKLLEEALNLRQKILEDEQGLPRDQLALAYHQIGGIWKQLGKYAEATEAYGQAIREFEQLAAASPGQPDYKHYAAFAHNDLAEVLRAVGSTAEAQQNYLLALKGQESLNKALPPRAEYQQEWARTCNNYGIFLRENLGDPASMKEAGKRFDLAIKLLGGLETGDPAQPSYRADLARSYINRAVWQSDPNTAAKDLKEAITRLESLKLQYPARHDYRYRLGAALIDRGEALRTLRKFEEARQAYREAIDLYNPLVEEFPRHHLYRKDLAAAYNDLGLVLEGVAPGEVNAAYENARRHYKELVADPHLTDLAEYKSLAAQNLHNLGRLSVRTDPEAARALLEEAVDLQGQALELKPNAARYVDCLAGHYYFHAFSLLNQSRTRDVPVLCASTAGLLSGPWGRGPLLAASSLWPERVRANHAAAGSDAEKILDLPPGDETRLWCAADIFACCVPAAAMDSRLGAVQRQEAAAAYARRALEVLGDLSVWGGADVRSLDNPDFDALRGADEFRRLRGDWKVGKEGAH